MGNYMSRWFVAMLAASFHLSAVSATVDLDILPVGKPVPARVMQLGLSPEATKLTERFKAALESRPEWTSAYASKYKNHRGTLPYHENMGLSKAEYDEMVQLSKQMKLVQVGTVELSAMRQPDNSIQLRTNPHLPGIDGVIVDGAGQAVTTRFARLTEAKSIDNTNPDGPAGRWAGTQWRHESISENRMLSVKLALGKRPEQLDAILYLDVKDVSEGKNNVFYEILLFQPGP